MMLTKLSSVDLSAFNSVRAYPPCRARCGLVAANQSGLGVDCVEVWDFSDSYHIRLGINFIACKFAYACSHRVGSTLREIRASSALLKAKVRSSLLRWLPSPSGMASLQWDHQILYPLTSCWFCEHMFLIVLLCPKLNPQNHKSQTLKNPNPSIYQIWNHQNKHSVIPILCVCGMFKFCWIHEHLAEGKTENL